MEKTFIVKSFETNRQLAEYINSKKISKEDIVNIIHTSNLTILYYYK